MTPMTEDTWPAEVDAHARASGWYPGRNVDISAWLQAPHTTGPHPAAVRFLTEFGGLHIPKKGTAGIDFAQVEMNFDPTLSGPLDNRLYPLGEADGGHASIGIDDTGAVYLVFGDYAAGPVSAETPWPTSSKAANRRTALRACAGHRRRSGRRGTALGRHDISAGRHRRCSHRSHAVAGRW